MALNREERKLLHQKSQQPTFGSGKPDSREGSDGDISFRKVEGSGTVQYLKENNDWTAISSTGEMPAIRIAGGGSSGGVGGVSNHASLSGLESDDHEIYLLIDGTRAMTSVITIGADSDGTDRSITWGHSTLKTIMGIDDSSDAFVINTDAAFDATLANNSFSIDANHNVIIAGDVSVGDDLFLTSSGSIINWNSGDVTLTHSANTITVAGGTFAAAAITGTTIDASTDFTIDGLVITADTISNDADLTIDGAADIILSADGDQIKMDDGSTTRFVFNVDSTPEIDVTGAFTIDGSSTIRLDSVSDMDFLVNGREVFKFDTSGHAYFHNFENTFTSGTALFQDYKINNLADKYHFISAFADFKQCHSMLAEEFESAAGAFNPDYGA
jgi:hypothetical protein